MNHLSTASVSAVIGHPAAQQVSIPAQPWPIHRNKRGWPCWYQRWLEAWWILTGEWSLHRAWQHGLDQGARQEYQRVVINGGDSRARAKTEK